MLLFFYKQCIVMGKKRVFLSPFLSQETQACHCQYCSSSCNKPYISVSKCRKLFPSKKELPWFWTSDISTIFAPTLLCSNSTVNNLLKRTYLIFNPINRFLLTVHNNIPTLSIIFPINFTVKTRFTRRPLHIHHRSFTR